MRPTVLAGTALLLLAGSFLLPAPPCAFALTDVVHAQFVRESPAFAGAEERLKSVWAMIQALPENARTQALSEQRAWIQKGRDAEARAIEGDITQAEAYAKVTNARAAHLEKRFVWPVPPYNGPAGPDGPFADTLVPGPPRGPLALSGDMYLRYTGWYKNDPAQDFVPSVMYVRIFRKAPGKADIAVQEIAHGIEDEDHISWSDELVIKDYNLDGFLDFSLPTNAGNVMRFSAVYLYNPKTRTYTRSENLGVLPCIDVDTKKRRVGGYCFHNNACNNWTEEYTVHGFDTLDKVLEYGTECGPPDGDGDYYFTYEEHYSNGKVVNSRREKISDSE